MADSILRLKVESQEYDAKLKRAADGLQRYADQCRKAGGTLEHVEKDTLDFVKAIGQMETVSRSATGKLGEMKKAFTEFSMQYKEMTAAEKASPIGKALSQSLDQLKVRIKDAQKGLQEINKELQGGNGKFGQFGSIIDGLGQKMGVNANLTELLTSKTALMTGAIGASTTAVVAATKAWADYNSEIAKQQQITTVTTGLKGDDADRMTAAARALAKTYNVDFREAINAANTFMTQFGKTGDEAIQLLRDGMRGMIKGDGPKLLSMIQQFAPAFRDAGISADKLVAIIHNSEGGLFSEQNMNAILMGIKNIRLMTKATSDALAQLGIDGQKMSKKMADGSMTVFEALRMVAEAIEGAKAGSQEAGQVMQAVFGRQGAMQGMKLGRAIAELNTNLEETKRQTGEVGDSFDHLYRANVKLEQALQKTFGYKGWEEMAIGIKTQLITAMANVLELTNKIKESWIGNVGKTIFSVISEEAEHSLTPLGQVLKLLKLINGEKDKGGASGTTKNENFEYIKGGATKQEREDRYGKVLADINKNLAEIGKEKMRKNADGSTSFYIDTPAEQQRQRQQLLDQRTQLVMNYDALMKGNPAPSSPTFDIFNPPTTPTKTGSHTATKSEEQEINESIRNLTIEYRKASQERQAAIRDEIKALQDQLAVLKQLDEEAQGKRAIPGGMSVVGTDGFKGFTDETAILEQAKTVVLDTITPFDQFTQHIEYLKGVINDPPSVEVYKMAREELERTESAFKKFKGDGKSLSGNEEAKQVASQMSQVTNGISSMVSGMQQLGVEIPEGMAEMIAAMQAMSGILTAILTITTLIEGKQTVSTIASLIPGMAHVGVVHAANGWSGVIPGNTYSGDQIPIMANAGETVLTAAQTNNLASSLQSGGGGDMKIVGVLTGENVVLMADRWGKRTGKGELMFGKNI